MENKVKMNKFLPWVLLKFKNLILIFLSIFFEIYYSCLTKISTKLGIIKKKRKIPLIVSLTTFPARIKKVNLVIETIFQQTIKADYIYLWLSSIQFPNMEKDLPIKLLKLQKRGLEIMFVDEDLRSYKKFYYTIQKHKKCKLITIDDDCFYPKTLIYEFTKNHNLFPNDILCTKAHEIKFNNLKILPYETWSSQKKEMVGEEVFPVGFGGVFYPPNAFHKEILNKKIFLKICPLGDDIWLKTMTLKNNKRSRKINSNSFFPLNIIGSQKESLCSKNVGENKNNLQIKQVFGKYKISKILVR